MAIQNRYEFMYYVACTNANPNGDPDMGNNTAYGSRDDERIHYRCGNKTPRIRNYVQLAHGEEPGMNLIIQQGNKY